MAKKSADEILSDSHLAIAAAEKAFGWKNVHKHNGELIGEKQDKLGRWRKAKTAHEQQPLRRGVGSRR